jgi:hypothetical protein
VLKSELPDLFILEKGRDGHVAFRLAGTRVCVILGREMRGQAFKEVWELDVRHKMRLAVDAVLANRSALEIAVTAVDEDGRSMALEMLLLPLFSKIDVCDRIFGSLVSLESAPTRDTVARRLQPAQLSFTAIEENGPRKPQSDAVGAFSGLVNRVTHLRVFEGGRRD